MMNSISPVLSESYDDVFAAVQDSARGRWFLTEYAARLRTQETKTVLEAIHKLESVVAAVPASKTSAPAIERVKAAIEQAKTQLGNLKPDGKPLSQEAQVFAHLAKLSQRALATEASPLLRETVGKGLDVALNFVQDLENDFGFAPPPKLEAETKPPVETQKYFHQDSDVFAPVQVGASTTVQFKAPAPQKPLEDQSGKGARLTIHKGETTAKSPTDNTGALEAVPANNEPKSHQPSPEENPADTKPRIVIIRRKPEELSAVPLADVGSAENAA
jgi:hypothetical protein